MYEFLAPWGVLAPAVCAFAIYWIVSEKRRQNMMMDFDAPEDAASVSRRSAHSGLA